VYFTCSLFAEILIQAGMHDIHESFSLSIVSFFKRCSIW